MLLGNRCFSWHDRRRFWKRGFFKICLRGLHLCCVPLQPWSARRLRLQHLAVVPTPNIAELVHSGFFCLQPWFLWRSEHIFPGKTPACLSIEPRTINNWINRSINSWIRTRYVDIKSVANWSWRFPPEPMARCSIPRGGGCLFFTTSMRMFYEINKYQRKKCGAPLFANVEQTQ